MPLYRVRETRIYYVSAPDQTMAEMTYGDAHPNDAAEAEIADVEEIRDETEIANIVRYDNVIDAKDEDEEATRLRSSG